MDGRPNRRNKAAFSNFSGVVRTRLCSVFALFRTSRGSVNELEKR